MTKKTLIEKVAAEAEVPYKQAAKVIMAALSAIEQEVISGNSVELYGFGNFVVRYRRERNGVNPQTGEPIKIPASKFPAFKASKIFKSAVNGDGTAAK